MNLSQAIKLGAASDFMGPGGIGVAQYQKKMRADSSSSDLAHHHSYKDPSSTDFEQLRWKAEGSGRKPVFGNPPKDRIASKKCGCRHS